MSDPITAPARAKDEINHYSSLGRFELWISAENPPVISGDGFNKRSEIVWLRVREVWDKEHKQIIRPAYTTLGRCVIPQIGTDVSKSPDAPAIMEWSDDACAWESLLTKNQLDVTHWLPCNEPLPPGVQIPETSTGANNVLIEFDSASPSVAEVSAEREWIPVAERLPEKYGSYLIWFSYSDPAEGGWSHVDLAPFENGRFCASAAGAKITHWMPEPKPPVPKGEE